MREGDIIVVGSDGLFDNVSFKEILLEVEKA
jgi:serine/threonine protein phosphatase PrpC